MNSVPYMSRGGSVYKYGEFFPPEFSPLPYNETWAQEYFPLSKDTAGRSGFSWRDRHEQTPLSTLDAASLPNHIKNVPGDIVNQIIQCAHASIDQLRIANDALDSGNPQSVLRNQSIPQCNEQCTTAFKIIPQELAFYRKMSLPLPRLCPNCRHYQRLKQRNPLKLWKRRCMCVGSTGSPQAGETAQLPK